ncbi:MAG: hypothetical protein HYX94_01390 [Chloroflexi bacterium]|nr:hypothetical protein [Chloroflexota bacterium]
MINREGDRHVLAAAVRGQASVVVTWNKADFPAEACTPYAIDVQTPDEFLCFLWHHDSQRMAQVLKEQSTHLIKPPQTLRQLLATLERSVPVFVQAVLSSTALSDLASKESEEY